MKRLQAPPFRSDVAAAYFDNLEARLSRLQRRAEPGRLVLGLGPGRCGSTTLTALFKTAPDCCATHENPAIIDWTPRPEQIQFHLKRFSMLVDYFEVVFDAAHWWINLVDLIGRNIEQVKFIILRRPAHQCAISFNNLGRHDGVYINNWAPPGSPAWTVGPWNQTYPTYDVPAHLSRDEAKLVMTLEYVNSYYDACGKLSDQVGANAISVDTETLSSTLVQRDIFDFAECAGVGGDFWLNRQNYIEGASAEWLY